MRISRNNLKAENEVLKRLLKDGFVHINYDSTDCDGCTSSGVYTFNDLESLYKSIDDASEWADGPFRYSVPAMYKDGSLDLNVEYNGGQWQY
jgi:predicted porin